MSDLYADIKFDLELGFDPDLSKLGRYEISQVRSSKEMLKTSIQSDIVLDTDDDLELFQVRVKVIKGVIEIKARVMDDTQRFIKYLIDPEEVTGRFLLVTNSKLKIKRFRSRMAVMESKNK